MTHKKSMTSTRRFLLNLAAVLSVLGGFAQSAYGGPLYFDYNENFGNESASLFLFGDAGQNATVSNLAGFNTTVTLDANGFFNLSLSNSYAQSGTGIKNTGFKVESSDPLAGYFVNRAQATTDMTYLFDGDSLGKDYVVASHGTGHGEGSQIMVHATEDNTQVSIDLPGGGSPINVTLQAGETYKYAAGLTDTTGARVTADKNVAVFGGHSCADIPNGATSYCDALIEQMIPVANLSTTYHVTASEGAAITPSNTDTVKVVATADNTVVTIDGVNVATINDGEFYQFDLLENTGSKIETSAPVLVAQFLEGGSGTKTDPAMAVVPGSDSWLDYYRLATPSGGAAFDKNYASVIIDSLALGSLALDGSLVDTSGFSSIAGTSFMRGIVNLPLGLFELTANDTFLVMLGGGENADSYFTFGGATFAPGISSVPEPGALGLLGLGYMMLLLGRRRKTA